MKNIAQQIILLIPIVLVSSQVFAQGPPGPPATPIDGGLSLLLAAGGIYGVKKLNDRRKQQK
ncbi:MAG: hypothetical protein AAFQ94_15905 [Bacteroidota bacterium]